MLKLGRFGAGIAARYQPPSGGCVLKPQIIEFSTSGGEPAAFRRLCVETRGRRGKSKTENQPPSGGCVLKQVRPKRSNFY